MTTYDSVNFVELQPLTISGETYAAPTSFAQERLWFLDQFEPNSSLYNITVAMRAKGNISAAAIQSSVNALILRHETLRTIFGTEGGRPIQIIYEKLQLPLSIEVRTGVPLQDRDAVLTHLLEAEINKPFDITKGPLARVRIIQLAEDDYGLFFVFHHIIFDGWSAGLFFKELNQLYIAALENRQANLPEISIQYADFAEWQKEWLKGDNLAQEMEFWKQHLAGAPKLIDLPVDHPRPAAQTFRGTSVELNLSRELTEELEALTRKQQATMFMTLLTAFEIFLSRYCGQKDFVIGSPIAGRTRIELEQILGFFANTIVLRADVSDNPTFIEALKRVREVSLNAFAHQNVPFEKLVEELQPERSLSYNPLFQVMFTYQNTPDQEIELGSLELSDIKGGSSHEKFDLSLSCWKEDSVLKCFLSYNTDLFDTETIQRMKQNFITLLQGIVANPEQNITTLPLLSETEQQKLLVEWNNTAIDVPQECAHQLIAAQAQKNPEAIALDCNGQTLTYKELERRANQFARYLQRLGVATDQPVGLCVNRSIHMIIAMLGILKAGGAYVPLDPDYPAERLQFMADDAKLQVLVTDPSTKDCISAFAGARIDITADWETIAQEDTTPPASQSALNNLAYIIYTSGSTGVPKGVQIPHGALVNFLASMQKQPGMTEGDTGLALTSISFDIAGLEIYLPLTLGLRMVLVSRETALDARQLAACISTSGVTVIQATPATWRSLIDAGWQGNSRLKILCGGEALPQDLAHSLMEHCGELWNMYGPTETTIWSAIHRVESTENSIAIGKPIANTQIYILDSNLQLAPIGATGEIYIGGMGLARGYRNRPDLTSERFISNPYTTASNARIYRTGDAARFRQDGSIEYLGRLDTQVKVRGFRIELGEIEATLEKLSEVKQAVVVVREDIPGDQRITAYITTNGSEPSAGDLRAFLQTCLPAYMIPAAFVTLERYPLTPNGKVDRKALPAPDGAFNSERPYIAPRTPEEIALAEIWAELLGVSQVGAEDNFFELGGHSLLATQMISRVRDVLHAEVPLRTLFEAPTIEAFAAAIVVIQEQPAEAKIGPITRSARRSL